MLAELERRGWDVVSRATAIETLISICSPLPRNRGVLLRRISTFLYKLSLISSIIAGLGSLFVWGDLLHLHRLRAAMRVAEDVRLHHLASSTFGSGKILNISEGFCQHCVALLAWRKLLGHVSQSSLPANISPSLFSINSLVIFIELPVSIAEKRLRARGAPLLWPAAVNPKDVLTLFADCLPSAMASLQRQESLRVVQLDGAAACADWQRQSTRIADGLQLAFPSELGGKRGAE